MSTSICIDPDIPERSVCCWEADEATSLLVWFHGGGLIQGAKASAESLGRRLASRGCTVVSADYRLYPQARHPQFLEDCAAAVAWGRERFPGLPTFISGASAGGWLAAMLAVDGQYLEAVGLHARELAGVIPVSGQMLTHFAVAAERGVPLLDVSPETPDYIERRPWADDAAPIHHAKADIPPWFSIAGSRDLPGRPEECELMVAAMRGRGHQDAQSAIFEGREHCTILGHVHEEDDPVFAAIADFVQRHTATCPKPA